MPAAGTKLGPYEILSAIGAGGMGEVYRARDPRIGREVAIKVLPVHFSQDSERLRRFEQEARATGVLNHPNILGVYDVGTENGAPYLVTELLQGETLRKKLSDGPLPMRKSIDYALQIAHGLSAAHEKGIIHRDLKPENIFITKESRLKILDFGLAKLTHPEVTESKVTEAATRSHQTDTGVVMGTVLYMSPEQVRGEKVDYRSDIFGFGTILYEMISGKRPFSGESQIEIMHSILKTEPPPLSESNKSIPPALEKTIQRCLEKDPDHRFQSTSDLAFALEALSSSSGATTTTPMQREEPRRKILRYLTAALVALAAIAAVFYASKEWGHKFLPSSGPTGSPHYTWTRVTFRNGNQNNARFASDEQTVVYDANWDGKPSEMFFARIGSPEARSFGLKDVELLSLSSTGELAMLKKGTLMQMPFAGGMPREILEDVQEADWSPDGKSLMVCHSRKIIEFPIGKALYKSDHVVFNPRFSPKGDQIAFIEMRAPGIGSIFVMDLNGKTRKLHEADMSGGGRGLAWSPSGDEIWFVSRPKKGNGSLLNSVSLSGKYREIIPLNQRSWLYDISKDGRVLLSLGTSRSGIIYFSPTGGKERDLSWLDGSQVADISDDGKTLLFFENGDGMGTNNRSVYIRNVDAPDAVRLGDGWPYGLSPDSKWALTHVKNSLVLLPTGAGQVQTITKLEESEGATWFPDGKRILYCARTGDQNGTEHLIVQDISGGEPKTISKEGIWLQGNLADLISPDGKWVIAVSDETGGYLLHSTEGDQSRNIPELQPGEEPVRWSADGSAIFVESGVPTRIFRVDLKSGQRQFWKELMPADPAGLHGVVPFLTPDGKTYAYGYARTLTDLYVIEGLK